jgi:uncharacterized protein (TIGR02679 family)
MAENSMSANHDRVRSLFGRPGLQRLSQRLRERRDQGRPLSGTLTLENVAPDERRAIDQVLRRPTTRGTTLRVPLDAALRQLKKANLANSWNDVLDLLFGPPNPSRTAAVANSKAWEDLWNRAPALLPNIEAAFSKWLEQMKRDGLLKRLSCDRPEQAEVWLTQACRLLQYVPLQDEPIAKVAARFTGNSHALDSDAPLATITLRAIAVLYGLSMPTSAAERRGLWSKAGIICDELSAPVLSFNLSLQGAYPLTELLGIARTARVPLHLSTRLLLTTDWRSVTGPERVYVCENASVIASIVRRLGSASAPVICLDGEPKTAGWLLLDRLKDAGSELLYHGDFDWKGVAIAGRVMSRVSAKPWRYSDKDYLAAPGTELLTGAREPTPWCPELATAMAERQISVHEEAVVDVLVNDLRTSR